MVSKAALLFMNDGSTDQAYINLRDEVSPEAAVCKRFAEELWQQYQPYADRDFRSSMRSAFHARFWEMYLCRHAAFDREGVALFEEYPGLLLVALLCNLDQFPFARHFLPMHFECKLALATLSSAIIRTAAFSLVRTVRAYGIITR